MKLGLPRSLPFRRSSPAPLARQERRKAGAALRIPFRRSSPAPLARQERRNRERVPLTTAVPGLQSLLTAVRRRLRLAWTVATGQLVAPVLAGTALVLVVVGRLQPWAWPEPAAVACFALALVALVVTGVVLRISPSMTARAADRGLETGDAFATALELEAGRLPDGPLAERVRTRATALATGRKAADAVRVHLQPRRLALSGGVVVLALGLALLPNAQDDVRRRRAAEQALAEKEAEALRKAAKSLTGQGTKQAEVARQLEALAKELERAPNLEAAQRSVDKAAAKLAAGLDPSFLGQKAAVRGLERSLATRPLPGTSGSAADQLRQAAAGLSGLGAEQLA